MSKSNAAVLRQGFLPFGGRKALRIRHDAMRQELPPFDAPKAYMPPLTLGMALDSEPVLAMDASLSGLGLYGLVSQGLAAMYGVPQFIGYAALSNLSQNGLIRAGVESVADEMTRKWLELQSTGDDDNAQMLTDLTNELKRLKTRQHFNDAGNKLGYFGGCLIYLDMGEATDAELLTPLVLDAAKVPVGSLKRLVVVEPINLYPGKYNASDPLAPDYFTPSTWRVLGREIHASRFLYFASNVPPLLLRPAYNFFGIPMAQVALDYVTGFTGNREAAARLLEKFSLTIWKTNMEAFLQGQGGTDDIDRRALYAAQQRDNDGVMLIDKELEDMVQINTPLGGVTDIVQMSLELLSAIFRIPAVKLFGISPKGFNATGDADMRNWYDYVASQQKKQFGEPMERLLKFVQLSLYGKIDDSITFRWLPLWEMDPAQAATIRKTDADTTAVLITNGVVSTEEARQKLAQDQDSGWEGLDLSVVPEPPVEEPQDGKSKPKNGAMDLAIQVGMKGHSMGGF